MEDVFINIWLFATGLGQILIIYFNPQVLSVDWMLMSSTIRWSLIFRDALISQSHRVEQKMLQAYQSLSKLTFSTVIKYKSNYTTT